MNGLGITTSFGLSNPDMPTPVMAEPRFAPPEDAGYGYELMIVTPRPEAWAMLPVSWFVQTEILRDVDLLDRVREIGGLTVEEILDRLAKSGVGQISTKGRKSVV